MDIEDIGKVAIAGLFVFVVLIFAWLTYSPLPVLGPNCFKTLGYVYCF